MDKAAMKLAFAAKGLPICDYEVVMSRDWRRDPRAVVERVANRLGFPVFAKPANLGSSVGISKAKHASELRKAIELAAEFDRKIVVEAAVPQAREIEVAVLGNEEPAASVPGEIEPSHEFYDYADKYLEEGAGLLVPADLTTEQVKEAQQLAIRAYEALRVDGMARVDFFFDEGGRGFVVNELNTIPGFTPISMFPRLWAASGLPYPALIDRLVELALQRHAARSGFSTSPSSP
jgi:D-alanine-D-alanine ligase